MSSESKKKRGESGVSNAKSNPYRYIGGSHENPVLTLQAARQALRERPSNFKATAHYANGMMGGALAALLGFKFPGWEELKAQYNL